MSPFLPVVNFNMSNICLQRLCQLFRFAILVVHLEPPKTAILFSADRSLRVQFRALASRCRHKVHKNSSNNFRIYDNQPIYDNLGYDGCIYDNGRIYDNFGYDGVSPSGVGIKAQGSEGSKAEKLLSSWPIGALSHLCDAVVDRLGQQRSSADPRCGDWSPPWQGRELSLQRSRTSHPNSLL
jgi:hypothetical protein